MKPITYYSRRPQSAVCITLLAALIVFSTSSCSKTSSWNPLASDNQGLEERQDFLESKIDRIRMQMDREKKRTERVDFWRVVSVALALLVFFALFGGAALGSRARRDRLKQTQDEDFEHSTLQTSDEVVC